MASSFYQGEPPLGDKKKPTTAINTIAAITATNIGNLLLTVMTASGFTFSDTLHADEKRLYLRSA